MLTSHCVWTVVLLSFWFTGAIYGLPSLPARTSIDCGTPEAFDLADTEEYNGTVEWVNITQGAEIFLESPSCPDGVLFLELDHTVGEKVASVITKKPLDAEALKKCHGSVSNPSQASVLFSYSITCKNGVRNNRTLTLYDINDNAPVFEKKEYSDNISEAIPVNSSIMQVKAFDDDISSLYNTFAYSIEPPITAFEICSDGWIFLRERLNCSETKLYNLTVRARDLNNNTGETTVLVHVWRIPGPHFEHDLYEAMMPENRVGPFRSIDPEPIKAEDGDKEIIYRIKKVSPREYWGHFTIQKETGVINVEKELDREKTYTINIVIMASLKNDSWQSTEATVVVSVKDVNEPPVFSSQEYRAEIFSVVPVNYPVVEVKATDPDVGDTLQYSLVTPSSMFAVEPSSGLVYVVSVAGESGKVSLQVKAEDQRGLYDTTTVEVTIKNSEEINVVKIYLNMPVDSMKNETMDLKLALERALRWSVVITKICDKPRGPCSRFNGDSSSGTYVDFLALAQNGSVILHKDVVEKRLSSEREQVLTELQAVFGPDVDFVVMGEGPPITTIVLGVLGSVAGIGVIVIAVMKTRQRLKNGRRDSMEMMPTFQSTERKDSMENMPTFWTTGTEATVDENRTEMQHAPPHMNHSERCHR